MGEPMSNESELKAKAIFSAYETLRGVEFALKTSHPLVAAHCTEARTSLLEAFPELRRVETVFQLSERAIMRP